MNRVLLSLFILVVICVQLPETSAKKVTVVLTYEDKANIDFIQWTNAGYVYNVLTKLKHQVRVVMWNTPSVDLSADDQVIFIGHGDKGTCEDRDAKTIITWLTKNNVNPNLERVHFGSCYAACTDSVCKISLVKAVKAGLVKAGVKSVQVGGGQGLAVIDPSADSNIIEKAWRIIREDAWDGGGGDLQDTVMNKHGGKASLDKLAKKIVDQGKSLDETASAIAELKEVKAFYTDYHNAFDKKGYYLPISESMEYQFLDIASKLKKRKRF
jgi:hypothetical protein